MGVWSAAEAVPREDAASRQKCLTTFVRRRLWKEKEKEKHQGRKKKRM